MKPFALGVIADLRSRRLLPVAILLAVALVAVPVVLRKSETPPVPPAPQPAAETVPGGLPSPDAALAGQPLVTMASLKTSSALRTFDSRDPFKPLQSMSEMGEDGAAGGSGDAVPLADGGSGGLSGADAISAGSLDLGGSTGSGDTGGGGAPSPTAPDLEQLPSDQAPDPEPDPDPEPEPDPDPEPGTYAIDVSFAGPEQARRVRGLPRLAMLPHASVPLLIFLGVSDGGGEAMFLVDSKLTPDEGEGTCRPSPERCATLGLKPGERQTFVGDEGGSYLLQLDQIRAISVEQAIRRRRASDARAASAEQEQGAQPPPPQNFLPVLVDIFNGG